MRAYRRWTEWCQSTTWFAVYRDADGILRTVPTGCRDKDAANAKKAELVKQAENIRSGTIKASNSVTAEAMNSGIAKQVSDYLENLRHQKGKGKRARISKAHLVDVKRSLNLIISECDFVSLREIDLASVQIWVSKQLESATRGWSHKTINSHVSALLAFCNWAVKAKRLMVNELSKFPMLDAGVQKHPRRALTPDELQRLLKVARLRPVAEYGRAIEKTNPNGKRAGWKRLPLDFAGIDAAYQAGLLALAKSPLKIAELEATGCERALIYFVLVSTCGWRSSSRGSTGDATQ